MASPRLLSGRQSLPGAVYVITTATVARLPVFVSEQAAQAMMHALQLPDTRGYTRSLAWVVMPDHLHWMFVLREATLSQVVQQLKSQSARSINASLGTQGRLWQPGFYAHQLRHHEDLMAQARYIMGNPVRGGLAQALGNYPYAWCLYGSAF